MELYFLEYAEEILVKDLISRIMMRDALLSLACPLRNSLILDSYFKDITQTERYSSQVILQFLFQGLNGMFSKLGKQ